MKDMHRFIRMHFQERQEFPCLLNADKTGYTWEEACRLSQPVTGLFRNLYWKTARFSLKYASRISDGIRLGFETGFDSGSSLDYVYRNQPSGSSAFGRFIDGIYLNSIGWRGIRQRKIHVEQLIKQAVQQLREQGKAVHIVDIAAGHGRYILEAVTGFHPLPESVLLRDYSDINIRDGQALIKAKELSSLVRFEKGDAFNREELALLSPRPSLAIISGLYELFGDNSLISASLSGLADSMEEGSYLIYTGQPWHPQLEAIARGLTSHRKGQAWIMRRRTQMEMDQLVKTAGFIKKSMLIDEWGIFSVSIAQRQKL